MRRPTTGQRGSFEINSSCALQRKRQVNVREQIRWRGIQRRVAIQFERRCVGRLAPAGRKPLTQQVRVALAESIIRSAVSCDRVWAAGNVLCADFTLRLKW